MTVKQIRSVLGLNGTQITLTLAVRLIVVTIVLVMGWRDLKADIQSLEHKMELKMNDRWTRNDDRWYTDSLCDQNGLIMPPHTRADSGGPTN